MGETGSCSDGRAMLSKSLIQFSVDGWGCVPSLLFNLKPNSQKTSQSNHTRNTALSNSMKLSHALWGHPRWVGIVERSDRMWSTGEGNGKPLQYSCLENPMNSMKRQNDRILKETRQANRCPICYWRSVEK